MSHGLEQELNERVAALSAAMGEDFVTVTKERQWRERGGKKAPNGHVFRLFEGGKAKGDPLAIGRGTPRPVLDLLDIIEKRPDVAVGFAKREVECAAKAAEDAQLWHTQALADLAEAEDVYAKAATASIANGLVAAVERAQETEAPDSIEGEGVETAKCEDDPKVHRVYVDGTKVGEVSNISKNKWQITSPFAPKTYKSKKAAIEELVG